MDFKKIIIVFFVSIGQLYGMQRASCLTIMPQEIDANPCRVLDRSAPLLARIAQMRFTNAQEIRAAVCNFERINPIFLLRECRGEMCQFTRRPGPGIREAYAARVVDRILAHGASGQLVHYVSFGSGEMFQDFYIINRALLRNPQLKLVVHCIDLCYMQYCDNEVSSPQYNLVSARLNQIHAHCAQHFPQGSCTIKLYKNVRHFIAESQGIVPVVVGAIDIQDRVDFLTTTVQDFNSLAVHCFQQDQSTFVVVCLQDKDGYIRLSRVMSSNSELLEDFKVSTIPA